MFGREISKRRFSFTYSSKDLAWFCIVYYIIMYPVHANLFFVLLFRLGNDAVKNKYHMNKTYDNKQYVVSCQIPIVYARKISFLNGNGVFVLTCK